MGGSPWNPNRGRLLKKFLDTNDLFDIGFKGSKFIWYKKEFGDFVLKERLNHCLINEDWLLVWPNSGTTHLALIGSDHCPLLFDSLWADDEECFSLIQSLWKDNDVDLAM